MLSQLVISTSKHTELDDEADKRMNVTLDALQYKSLTIGKKLLLIIPFFQFYDTRDKSINLISSNKSSGARVESFQASVSLLSCANNDRLAIKKTPIKNHFYLNPSI